MKHFILLLILVLLAGCTQPPFSENERLNYLDDTEAFIQIHREILRHEDMDGLYDRSESIQNIYESAASEFKRAYQGTELEKAHGFLDPVNAINDAATVYIATLNLGMPEETAVLRSGYEAKLGQLEKEVSKHREQ